MMSYNHGALMILILNFDDVSLQKGSLEAAQFLNDSCPSGKYVAKKVEHKLRVNLKLM